MYPDIVYVSPYHIDFEIYKNKNTYTPKKEVHFILTCPTIHDSVFSTPPFSSARCLCVLNSCIIITIIPLLCDYIVTYYTGVKVVFHTQ